MGPRYFIDEECKDAVQGEEFYAAEGHAIDFP